MSKTRKQLIIDVKKRLQLNLRRSRLALWLVLLVGLNLGLAACTYEGSQGATFPGFNQPPTPIIAPTPTPISVPSIPSSVPTTYAGWAYDVYPDTGYDQMVRDVRRIKQAGANVLWISHANPAAPYKLAPEVGLNPSVLDAYRDFAQFPHDDAVEIVESQKQMLRACREVGIKVVLSIGYHTQMGVEWSKRHPDHLRRRPDGKLWQVTNGNEPFATPYSPIFQADLQDYYAWIAKEYVGPFSDVITMLNLADEPSGGDYSKWAEAEFKRRTGYGFDQIGNDPLRQQKLGQFQSGVIVDYIKLAAGYWQTLKPGLPVTMSFDGGAMREDTGLPNLETLFQEAPPNFVLTWDMYPRDRGSLDIGVQETDINRLFFLVRAIGGYSAQYGRKVWLWSAANSWGLGQDVSEPGTVADAQANLLYLAQLMSQSGGHLEGLAVWNYNVKLQGLYNYSFGSVKKKASWNEDDMFNRVSALFDAARRLMSESGGGPQVIFMRPPEWQYRQIGANRADLLSPQLDFARFDLLAHQNIVSAEVGHWPTQVPASWANLTTVVTLTPPEYLSDFDINKLREWAIKGGTLVVSLGVAQRITGQAGGVWNGLPSLQVYGKGRLFVSREPTNTLFDSAQAERLKPFWHDLFGVQEFQSGYLLRTPTSYLYYQFGKAVAIPAGPTGDWASLLRYQLDGSTQALNQAGGPGKALQRSEFVFAIK